MLTCVFFDQKMLLLPYHELKKKTKTKNLLQLGHIFIYFLLTNQVFVLAAAHVEVQGKELHSFFHLLIHELQMN